MATVFVWASHMVNFGRRWTGHASMSITDTWKPIDQSNVDDYVSWVPGSNNDASEGGREKRVKGFALQDGWATSDTFLEDLQYEEGYVPDWIIRVDGLNVEKMKAKWNTIRTTGRRNYHMLFKNCSEMVATILHAGSSWTKHHHHSIWSPSDVKKQAHKLGGTDLKWEQLLYDLCWQGAISADEKKQLLKMKKRDAKRGTSTCDSYYARGQQVNPRTQITVGGEQIGSDRPLRS